MTSTGQETARRRTFAIISHPLHPLGFKRLVLHLYLGGHYSGCKCEQQDVVTRDFNYQWLQG